MGNIEIITDSTAALTREELAHTGIRVAPLSLHFQGIVVDECLPDGYDELYRTIEASQEIPTTSQPSTGRFVELFQQAIQEGRDVVAILLSSALSGTVNSAHAAAEIVGREHVTVLDSFTAVANLKKLVLDAWQMAQDGANRETIARMVEGQRPTMQAVLTVRDLIHLKRGGRLNNSQYFVGKLLNILPLIQLREGKLFPYAKVKGEKATLQALCQAAPEDVRGLTICHIQNPEGVERLRELLRERFPHIELGVEPISPVIGSHLGPGAIGYCYYS